MRLVRVLPIVVLGFALLAVPAANSETSIPDCFGQAATVVGTDDADVIVGTDGADVIVALGGADRIDGGAGVDLICAGPDVTEQPDQDRVVAGDGDDVVAGGAGSDTLLLGAGNDYAESGAGSDDVRGGAGDDYIDTGTESDVADGGAGTDFLTTGPGEDMLTASGGGADYLDGGEAADALAGGAGTSYLDGGPGSDRIASPSGHIEAGDGEDIVTASGAVSYVDGGAGADVLQGPGYLDGGPGADSLTGATGGGVYLDGGDGPDTLVARGNANTLDGGDGDDRLEDSAGSSHLGGGIGADVLIAGAGHDELHGDAGNDDLRGGAGSDTLYGGEGADVLVGGPDPDSFDGGADTDLLRAVDDAADLVFDCGPVFEDDRLVVDSVADTAVPRFSCQRESPRVYSPPSQPLVGGLYVALGDSFSSGEGTGIYDDDDVFANCHRGSLAWPRYYGRRYFGLADSSIDHRACTGARSEHLLNPWHEKGQERQIHTRKQTRTELVTFTIGGNDIDFGSLLVKVRSSLNDSPPSPAIGRGGTERQVNGKLQVLTASLRTAYRELRRIYPNARIVHVGYPRILPSIDEPRPHRCEWLGKKERDLADWILNRLNDTIRASAAASPHDIDYVDVSEALDGHELCTADPWMVDLASELNDVPGIGSGGSTERGHPNLQGQIAYTDAVAAGLE